MEPIEEDEIGGHSEDPDLARARSRNRSPQLERKAPPRQMNGGGGVITSAKAGMPATASSEPTRRRKPLDTIRPQANGAPGESNGLLSPQSAYPKGFGSSYWRNLSRSPSPLGLIPVHREWRAFVHKHEIPRKLLHVSIGFVALWLYHLGLQPSTMHPILLSLLIPIATVDVIRFRWPAFNQFYIRVLGAFMRESEAHDRYNGVIMYLAGLWATMRFCRKDVAVVSVLLLSWCDTAASTFGRLYGRYTPRVRKGKSLAGSLACFVFGVGASAFFWGFVAPRTDGRFDQGVNSFAYQGRLTLPSPAREAMGLSIRQATVEGGLALVVLSLASGLIASVSELADVWELDDNLTIPIFCGLGIGAFLWAFGGN